MNINGIDMETDFMMLTDGKLTKFDLFTLVALHGLLCNPNKTGAEFTNYAHDAVNYAHFTISEINQYHNESVLTQKPKF